jgi:uncharacterized protein (DUF2267 family)
MKFDEFLQKVEERTGVAGQEEALRTAVVVLQALCDRLTRKEASDLLAQLPARLKRKVKATHAVMRMTHEEFVERVARELQITPEDARQRVRGVFATLREAVSPGEFQDVVEELDPPYADLLA